jgi:ubiquinone/menaquinone biosynthesis C-methylase UbiE
MEIKSTPVRKVEDSYYDKIENYYDEDAGEFDKRYLQNPVLQRIRQDFREEVKRWPFNRMLEIGCGTGIDLVHFGKTHPGVRIAGIDISGSMQNIAREKIDREKLENVSVKKGSIEDIENLFPGERFDMVYVFFGALNTVEDLPGASETLFRLTMGGGTLVLTFVNKYYMAGMLIEMLKLRFGAAFSRLKPQWGGYSPTRHLPGRCYSPRRVKQAFSRFQLVKQQGYSIIHPAWYYHRLNRMPESIRRALWNTDLLLQKTPLWKYGEYALYVFQKPAFGIADQTI